MARKARNPRSVHRNAWPAVLSLLLCACATTQELKPFSTDGCSLFPDRCGEKDWCRCCLLHDLAYWKGGTAEQRRKADDELYVCVHKAAAGSGLAGLMYSGVRMGGTPHLPSWFRWGYGWPYGRGYRPLSPAEAAVADALAKAYTDETNHEMACPAKP